MKNLLRKIDFRGHPADRSREFFRRQWLVTNGLGGYASGTISGAVNWRYHGLLIAALPAPWGRMVMFNHLAEYIRDKDGKLFQLGGDEEHRGFLTEFRLENQLPVWRYEVDGVVIEKRLWMQHLQNTSQIQYQILSATSDIQLELRPSVHFRSHEAEVDSSSEADYVISIDGDRYEISSNDCSQPLRLLMRGEKATFTLDGGSKTEIFYQHDADRGYRAVGKIWSPGFFSILMGKNERVNLTASTEAWKTIMALDPDEGFLAERNRRQRLRLTAGPKVNGDMASELVLGADQFIITPAGREEDAIRARASGDEIRTVIAGYHWFTDWGRDTMISLEGLTLTTGRFAEAGWILRTFAHYVRDGLIPNMFPEGRNEGLYHTADASLWFFHAVSRYLKVTGDLEIMPAVLPKLRQIAEAHIHGTRFGIGVDPADGLLKQGKEGVQLTWMDAKVGDWVVTPRRGKAVEINALWYNALRLLEGWLRELGDPDADRIKQQAERARASFNERFWNEDAQCLFDVVDDEKGRNDAAIRPNQVFAISLPFAILDEDKWSRVLKKVHDELLTPVGLRSLSRGHPDYKSKYFGDLRSRDAAYHQGTVWAWLIGPFVDAWLKVHPGDVANARKFLDGFEPHLYEACVGSISEVFDAESPFTPRGCIAQAWSVAEVLRLLALLGQ